MNKRIAVFAVYILCYCFFLQKVAAYNPAVINGTLRGAEGKEIHLMVSPNYLSDEPVTLQKKLIESDGCFSFEIQVSAIIPVTLSINFYEITFFVAPGEHYSLNGKTVLFDNSINPFIVHPRLPLYLKNIDPLNQFIMQFNEKKSRLEITKYQEIFRSQDFSSFDSLMMPTDQLPEKYRDFCNKYQTYSIGALKAAYSKKRSLKLGNTYLNKMSPDIYDYCYMFFFNAFFDDYLPEHNHDISFSLLQDAINQKHSITDVFNLLKKDPILSNDELRALFLVKLLEDYPFQKTSVVKILKELISLNISEQVKSASEYVLRHNNQLSVNSTAPDFSFSTVSGSVVRSVDLKGKYLYINFFKTNCYDCLTAMEFMRSMYEKNNRFFEFISICIDNDESTFSAFLKNHDFPWKVVYGGYDQDFILRWQVKTVPYYILINDNYKIMQCPAQSPEEDIDHVMEKISWEEQRKQRKHY